MPKRCVLIIKIWYHITEFISSSYTDNIENKKAIETIKKILFSKYSRAVLIFYKPHGLTVDKTY